MPTLSNNASWDFAPNDHVTATIVATFDQQDTQDSAPVASALATIQSRISGTNITAAQSDPATITISITI